MPTRRASAPHLVSLFRVQDFRFRVKVQRSIVLGSGMRVQGLGCRFLGLIRFTLSPCLGLILGFSVQVLGRRV